ncbi:DUF5776 domain-containing protein [uncultured Secundilactobacillus sp.]|uniref:DUF5776 domain-containing protein n=1 Tax=uncultured Secundilactobacillus sp. TaxID=2813935 RepID=UPI00258729A4|nr:DUF5776 domain-containing protein [uncultured Secundilactobacillus sp.]
MNNEINKITTEINHSNAVDSLASLKQIAISNLGKQQKRLETAVNNYEKSGNQSSFNSTIDNLILDIDNVATPNDWETAINFQKKIFDERKREIDEITVNDSNSTSVTTNKNLIEQRAFAPIESFAKTTSTKKSIQDSFGTGIGIVLLRNSLQGTNLTSTPSEQDSQFANFILDSMAESREDAINALVTPTEAQKNEAVNAVKTAYSDYKTQLNASGVTLSDLQQMLPNFYKQFSTIVPATDDTSASESSKTNAIAALQAAYDTTKQTLDAVSGFDDAVKTALANAKTLLDQYTSQINAATSLADVNTILNTGKNKIKSASYLYPTTDDVTATVKMIDDAAAAQIASINADTGTSDSAKTTAITTVKNIASHYSQNAQAKNITLQVLKTIQTASVSSLKAITPIHDLTTKTVTASQLNAATNAIITAGNAKKTVIQNDSAILATDKEAAYTAIDGLVTTYTNQLKQATTTTALSQVQSAGVTAVTNFQATQSVTTTSPVTQLIITKTITIKPTNQKLIYAISSLKLYQSNQLKGKVIASYAKHRRTNRPVFKVLRTVKNDAGKKAYYVQNQVSGKKGYITTSAKSVAYAYYQTTPKRIKIISNGGLNLYKKSTLSGKQHHYQKGQSLKVHKLVKNGAMTRFQLMNGSYVTANKKMVISTAY